MPQNIFLSDDTVTNNIAFGLDPNLINLQAIEEASKIANLYNFVSDELPQKFDTVIGEERSKAIRRPTSTYWNCSSYV